MPEQKHIQHVPFTKMESDYLNGWIKNRSYTQISHKMVNPWDIAGNAEEKKKTKRMTWCCWHGTSIEASCRLYGPLFQHPFFQALDEEADDDGNASDDEDGDSDKKLCRYCFK